jgi:hypothetical protein
MPKVTAATSREPNPFAVWLLFVFLVFSLTLGAPLASAKHYRKVPPEQIFNDRESRYGHLKYVGFYASAMHHWNFTSDLAPLTNLTWVSTGNIDRIIQRMEEARSAGVKVVLDVKPFVFDADYRLQPDYLHRLSDIHQRLEYEGLADQLVMIYTVDEPYFRASRSAATNRDQMYLDVSLVNRDIKQLFPDTPVGVIFSRKEIFRDDFRIPEAYDWIGFNCYSSLFNCDRRPMTAYYGKLLAEMSPNQSLMAVPEAWVPYSAYERREYEPAQMYENRKRNMADKLYKRLQHHYEIALSEPRFVAFIPFLWSMEAAPGKPERVGFGVDRFDEMFPDGGQEFIDLLTDIGEQVKNGRLQYPGIRFKDTEKHLLRPPDYNEGRILEVSRDGWVSAWALNRALPHKSLRVQLVVYEGDNEVYRSGLKRTFIADNYLPIWKYFGVAAIGLHGYRHRLPEEIADAIRGSEVDIELRIFGDRARLDDFHSVKSSVTIR